jgi:hypothetical protein
VRTRSARTASRDAGASLILAIAFVVMIGAISAGLASLVTSSLNNRGSLELVRDRQYAADGAIEEAISQFRLPPLVSPLVACASADGVVTDNELNGIAIWVDWRNVCGVVRGSDGTVVTQRNVIFSACLDTGVKCLEADVIIRAQVNFEQSSSGAVTNTFVQSWSVNR